MENDQQDQPQLPGTGKNDIGSPLNPGHQKHISGTNDQNGDVQEKEDLPKGEASPSGETAKDVVAQDDRSAGGINDPEANKTPHPGANDGAPGI